MSRQYPRRGEGGCIKKGTPCNLCGGAEKVRPFVVQVNWFRGDDDVHPVCKECGQLGWREVMTRLGYRLPKEPTP